MNDRGGFLVVRVDRADIDLLLGLVFDPIVRRRIIAARDRKHTARTNHTPDCLLGLPTLDAIGLLSLLTEISQAEKSQAIERARAKCLAASFAQAINDDAASPGSQSQARRLGTRQADGLYAVVDERDRELGALG